MEKSLITEVFLPLALGVIMLGMGLSLSFADFKRVTVFPKAIIIGLITQLIGLPLIAFGLMSIWHIQAEFAVGIVLLSAVPGGPTSNLLAYLGKCDTALSITLTALTSFITIVSIPFIVNYAMELYMGKGSYVELPVLRTMAQILIITIIPVSLGMWLNKKFPATALRFQRPVKIASTVFIAIIILGAVLKDRENLVPSLLRAGAPALVLNIITMAIGFGFPRLLGLNFKQSSTISMEAGIQNGTLAIAIATSATMLNNPSIAIVPALYSLFMFVTGGIAAFIFARKNGSE